MENLLVILARAVEGKDKEIVRVEKEGVRVC